jgi:hypothetical protein
VANNYVTLKNCSFFNNTLISSTGLGVDIHHVSSNSGTYLTSSIIENCCSSSVHDSHHLFTVGPTLEKDSLLPNCTTFTCDKVVKSDSDFFPCGPYCVLGIYIVVC